MLFFYMIDDRAKNWCGMRNTTNGRWFYWSSTDLQNEAQMILQMKQMNLETNNWSYNSTYDPEYESRTMIRRKNSLNFRLSVYIKIIFASDFEYISISAIKFCIKVKKME